VTICRISKPVRPRVVVVCWSSTPAVAAASLVCMSCTNCCCNPRSLRPSHMAEDAKDSRESRKTLAASCDDGNSDSVRFNVRTCAGNWLLVIVVAVAVAVVAAVPFAAMPVAEVYRDAIPIVPTPGMMQSILSRYAFSYCVGARRCS